MKILFITSGLSVGGAEMMLYQLCSFLDRNHIQPFIVCLSKKSKIGELIEESGVRIHYLNAKSCFVSPFTIIRLIRYTKESSPDLIQGWMYHGNFAGLIVGTLLKIPVIWSIHHTPYSLKDETIMLRLLIRLSAVFSRQVCKIIYCSSVSAEKHQMLGYEVSQKTIIPNGFDIQKFIPRENAKSKFYQQTGIPDHTFLIGHIARFHPMKDHLNFIEAAGLFHQQYPDAHFVMIGNNINFQNKHLVDKIREAGLGRIVHLLGEMKQMHLIIPAFDVITNSSAWGESFPIVVGEAMSCGVPCVVTDVGDSAHLVGDAGIVVPPKNAKALADAWILLMQSGEKGRAEMGMMARERIINHFSIQKIALQYETLYETMKDSISKC